MTRIRGYAKTAAMASTAVMGESLVFLLDYGVRFLRVALLLSVWRLVMGGRGSVGGMTLGALLTYTLVAEVFGEQLSCRIGLEDSLWEGNIATRFVRPMGLVEQFSAETAGRWTIGLVLCSIPLLVIAPFLGVDPRPATLAAGLYFVPSLALSVTVGLALEFIMGALLVYFHLSPWSINRTREAVVALVSGRVIPLALLPWGLGGIFAWLPFAAAVSAPLQIYTGTGDPGRLLAMQAGWAVVLWPVALWMWRLNRQLLVGYGG
jgi:ABC-2 type transport system permease protein